MAEAREGGATGRALLLDAAPNVTALHQVASAEHDRAGSACDSVLPRAADAPPPVALLSALWAALCAVWSDELAAVMATAQYAFMRTNLVDVYPRLHYALLSVHSTTEKSVALRSATGVGIDLFQAACQPRGLVWAAAPLLRAFLSKSVARLNESVARCFPHPPGSGGSAVTRAAVRGAMGSSATSLASSSEQANGFHVSHDFARALDVLPHDEAPSTAAIAAVLRSVAQEFSMCRPSGVYAGEQVDVALMGAVSRVVTSTLRQLVSRMEAAALTSSPAATVLVDHCMPTPVQRHHLALACRLDEVRAACVRLLSELPLPAALGGSESTSAAPDGGTHSLDAFSAATLAGANSVSAIAGLASSAAVCAAATSARRRVHPLALPVPTSLSLLAYYAAATQEGATSDAACGMLRACGASDAEVDTVSAVVGATAHGQLLLAIASVEQLLHGLILPWAARLMLPLERTSARMHEASYAAAVGDAPQMTSAYVTEAHAIVSRLNEHQLSLLSPGALNDAVRTLLCGRLLNCICFHLCLVRGLVSAPASRFHTDSGTARCALHCSCPVQTLHARSRPHPVS
ncbi:MAG: hypothetical protein EOO41_02975 [Methanobacteriota archaeon]|nr:MAG: hypothetical protein EOO41_02975 [Euryarchaeota archaeon]